jgi:hypothetical protein
MLANRRPAIADLHWIQNMADKIISFASRMTFQVCVNQLVEAPDAPVVSSR